VFWNCIGDEDAVGVFNLSAMSFVSKLGIACFTYLMVLFSTPSFAQTQTTGRISGTVKDSGGRIVLQAEIRAVATDKGELHQTFTNESGDFFLLALSPGKYEISVSAKGFRSTIFQDISLGAGDTITVNAVLQLAQNTTEITVSDTPPLVRTDSSELGMSLDSTVISSAPLASRNSLQLLTQAPGTSSALTNNSTLGRNSPEISVNGARVSQNSMQINGVDANNPSMHDFADVGVPAPESVGQVVMQTSMYDASTSGAGGSSVGLFTKSGGNALHGSVYEYFQNDALDANDPNLKAVGLPRPELRRNVYGATLGGPIRKDRVFYFLSYQGSREINAATGQSLYSNVMIDPCLTNDRSAATLMQNCSISSVDPSALALLNYKLPNGQFLIPTPQTDGLATGTAPSTYRENQFNTNIDFRLGSNDLLTSKFFFADAPLFSALGWSAFGSSPTFPGFGTRITVNDQILSLQESHSFSAVTVNEVRFGYNFIRRNEIPEEPISDTAVGISRITADQFPGLPLIYLTRNTSGAAIGSNEITLRNTSPSLSFFDFLSLQRGEHTVRIGGEIRHSEWNVQSANVASYGEIDFASFHDFLSGNSEFSLLGTGQANDYFRTTDYQVFAQDDWRISSKLILNLGLRYELDPPPYESQGRIGGFDLSLYQPQGTVDPNGFPLGPPMEGIVIPGVTRVGKRILKSIDPHDFGPRIGLAWSPFVTGRLAIRAGYGIFYSRPSFLYLGLNFAEPPFYQVSTFFGQPFGDPFPGAPPSNSFPLVQSGPLLGSPFAFVDRNNRNPYFQQFNASVQYEVIRDAVLQIGYVGSRGLRLYRQLNVNQSYIASLDHPITNVVTGEVITTNTVENAALRAPLQGVDPSLFSLNQSSGQSSYNSLQASLNKRMLHGLQLSASYTFSKSIDNASEAGGGAYPDGTLDTGNGLDSGGVYGNQLDPRVNRGVSDFDRTHRFVMNCVWNIPAAFQARDSRADHLLFSNWQVSGIVIAMSGLPVDIFDPAGGTLYGQIYGARPNWAPGATIKTATQNIPPGYYFNPFAFQQAVVQPGQPIPSAHDPSALAGDAGTDYGNLGRNLLRGPFQSNVDLSLMKEFLLTESKILQFRADFFNALNHASRSNPVSDISSATLDPNTGRIVHPGNFGRILGTDSSPRILQFSLRFSF
jgi:hypothetical protein